MRSQYIYQQMYRPSDYLFLNAGSLQPLIPLFIPWLAICLLVYAIQRLSKRIPNFTGPKGLPIVRNILQIRWNASEQYRIWALKYSAVYQVQLGHVPVIVINSAAAAKSILGQNTQAMSSRPVFPTFHKVYVTNHTLEAIR